MNVSRQIGWSQESNLLYQILKQLNKLTSIMFGLKPKYKVYTALVTQNGGDDQLILEDEPLTIGVTYQVDDPTGGDFTNVGAPDNNQGTFFIATGTTPNSWGAATLLYNTGAPVVTVLENTIGNIWFTYDNVGIYFANSNTLFTENKTWYTTYNDYDGNELVYYQLRYNNENSMALSTNGEDSVSFTKYPIEIRVYN
jgi:hypothetical protein